MSLLSVILVSALVLNTVLGLFVFLGKRKNISNIYYFVLVLFVSIWILMNFSVDFVKNIGQAKLLSSIAYISILGIGYAFLSFCYSFPKNIFKVKSVYVYLVVPVLLVLLGASVFVPGFVIKDIDISPWKIHTGIGVIFIFATFFILMAGSFALLIKKLLDQRFGKVEKSQLKLIVLGTMAASILGSFFNLIIPLLLNNYDYVKIGPVFTLIMLICIAAAIVRYQLFNIKVVATETFVITLCAFLFIRTLVAESLNDQIINGILFILTLVVSIFLIKSVKKEVRQREKIQLLATDLQKANDRLTELDRQKSEFVSFATHQLRAPLTAMKGYASLIMEGDMGEVSKPAKDAVGRIFESSNTLASIVDDYLNVTRIELGTMKYAFETMDLKTMIIDVIAELKPNIDKATQVKFSFEAENSGADYRITADRDKLKQVIANLIDNSIKYTPKGFVKATLGFDRDAHKFLFKLTDSGIGIAPETIPLLFNKFSRAGNANKTNIKGTGLGLFVAKEIITAHHGTIKVESQGEGKGSTFTVEFEPFAKA